MDDVARILLQGAVSGAVAVGAIFAKEYISSRIRREQLRRMFWSGQYDDAAAPSHGMVARIERYRALFDRLATGIVPVAMHHVDVHADTLKELAQIDPDNLAFYISILEADAAARMATEDAHVTLAELYRRAHNVTDEFRKELPGLVHMARTKVLAVARFLIRREVQVFRYLESTGRSATELGIVKNDRKELQRAIDVHNEWDAEWSKTIGTSPMPLAISARSAKE